MNAEAKSLSVQAPRNPWARASKALDAARHGYVYEAERVLDSIRYHPQVSPEVFEIYRRQVTTQRQHHGLEVGPFNCPADYLSCKDERLRQPFRRIDAHAKFPSPYPFGLALPRHVGAGNNCDFLDTVAAVLAEELKGRITRVHVVLCMAEETDATEIATALQAQTFSGQISLTLFGGMQDLPMSFPVGSSGNVVPEALQSASAMPRLRTIVETSDLVIFLGGKVQLDPDFIARAVHLPAVSDNVVQPIRPMRQGDGLLTPFDRRAGKPLSRFPFRDFHGPNFVVPSRLLKRIGLFDTRFDGTFHAVRELAFRMHRDGAYFAPLLVRQLDFKEGNATDKDKALYMSLCPNPWDRKADGVFEVPRVSIYIPAYNASKYIQRAVDSVLEQDMTDLEVCIADDGSRDGTSDLLEKLYGDEPRVRFQRFPNGGIGFASNRAIEMARGPYIGQLDSDDCLKPGAVRRLASYLDEHPQTACVYGSCERIDADGSYIKDEYSWPVFSREKMMITSITHHFRMFRRSAWERTSKFREDIVNAVDYDIFLKLSEVGPFHHIDEVLYQRRWHGENTSNVNEGFQTTNTHRVQREALKRMGLDKFWDVHVPDPANPRKVTYKRRDDTPMVLFWPDYSRSNPYQHLLYGGARDRIEICAGDIDAALGQIDRMERPDLLTFHLHWLNFVLLDVETQEEARARVDAFLGKVESFVKKGGRLVWTIHNTVSHDSPYQALEVEMSNRIAAAAHALHFHCAGSVEEVAEVFEIPREKVRVSRHGSYVGAYSDFVTRDQARARLGLGADEDVILFTGQVRPYKGVEQLIAVFRRLLAERPQAVLLIVGRMTGAVQPQVMEGLTEAERKRIRATRRFVTDFEMQLFLRAADVAVYPYQKILTSGSLMLALSFGVPAVIPKVAMTREVLEGTEAGVFYDEAGGEPALETAIRAVLARKDAGTLGAIQAAARDVAVATDWPDFGPVLVA